MPQTKLLTLVGAGVITALLAGCTTTDHMYSNGQCLTCINNPLTGEPVNYDPDENPVFEQQAATGADAQQPTSVASGDGRGSFLIESTVGVDTAYARLRSGFAFRSPSDFGTGMSDSFQMQDVAWHHETNPGSFYRISDYERQTINGTEHRIVLKAQIERNGSGSRIKVNFGPSGRHSYNSEDMQAALEQRFEAVLR